MKIAREVKISDNGFVFNSKTGDSFSLNPTGLELINMLSENKEMEEIREDKKKEEEVLTEAKDVLIKILDEFKEKQDKIGEKLASAHKETRRKASTVGTCPNCNEGQLEIRKGKFGRFIACNKHPDCKTTFSLPNTGMVKVSDKICEECKHPMIMIIRKRKKPQTVCINKECPSKKVEDEHKIEKRQCPKCKKGELVIRKSVYGSFLACNKYPKCRYTESLPNGNGSKSKK
jgi:DNA topoisomerase-1